MPGYWLVRLGVVMNIFQRFRVSTADSGDGKVSKNAWNDSLDIKMATNGAAGVQTVNAGCCAISVGEFEIVSGDELELAAGSAMEIL